jgi:hypothetical protein
MAQKQGPKQGLWKVEGAGAPAMLLWSDGYQHLSKKAIAKYRRLLRKRPMSIRLKQNTDIEARLVSCPVEGCWTFATEVLLGEHLSNLSTKWWFVGAVETDEEAAMTTVCPMCAKHARRFERTLAERILWIEERLDELTDEVEHLEDEDD